MINFPIIPIILYHSCKALFYKGSRGFLVLEWLIFDGVESCEMLDFSGFARSGCRSGFELRKSIFRSKYGCGTDSLVFAAGCLS